MIAETAQAERLRTTLICGFLGAGKTTFIKARLRDPGQRTVVLVNEFGSLGLDGAAIREVGDLHVVELPGGCICCSQKFELAATVADIAERLRPQRLFIEPSGVAEASEIVKVLTGPALAGLIRLDGLLTVVDAETLLDYIEPDAFGTFFLDQLGNANIVLVNKADLVSEEHLQGVIARIQTINNTALIVPSSFGQLPAELPENRDRTLLSFSPQPLPWEYLSLIPAAEFSREELGRFADLLADGSFGRILRAKGIVPGRAGIRLHLQLVGRRWTIQEQQQQEQQQQQSPRLTLIGFNLERRKLQDCLRPPFASRPSQPLYQNLIP